MKYKIRSIIYGLKNLWKWRKVIYKDRHWDHYYIYEILKTKLQFQADHLIKHGYHENSESDAKVMLTCVDLIDKVQNEYYIDEALNGLSDNKWTDEMFKEMIAKQDDAKRLLFKTLEENIEHWWN